MIREMLSLEAVGIYSVVCKLSQAWYFIPLAITQSTFPAIINAHKVSRALFNSRTQWLYDGMVWISLVVSILVFFLAKSIVNLLYGTEYSPAGQTLSIYIWSSIFVSFGVTRTNWLLSEGLQKYCFLFSGMGAVLNIVLNKIMIPAYGINGAAVATLLSQMTSVYIGSALFKPTREVWFMMTKSLFLISTFNKLKRYIQK